MSIFNQRPGRGLAPHPPVVDDDPMPSDTPVSPFINALRWALALVFVFCSMLGLQLVCGAVGALVASFAALLVDPSLTSGALASIIAVPLQLFSELGVLAVFLPWWLHLRPVSFLAGGRARTHPSPAHRLLRVLAIVLIGVGVQMLTSYALTYLLPLAPDLQAEYHEVQDNPVMNEISLLAVLALAVGAPVTEELVCRGVALEFALRAVSPRSQARWRDRRWRRAHAVVDPVAQPIPAWAFWTANLIQAVLFGALHLNIVQGIYAACSGLIFGWLTLRSGSLASSMGAHLVVNLTSYFVYDISLVIGAAGLIPAIALSFALLAGGIALFARLADDDLTASPGSCKKMDPPGGGRP